MIPSLSSRTSLVRSHPELFCPRAAGTAPPSAERFGIFPFTGAGTVALGACGSFEDMTLPAKTQTMVSSAHVIGWSSGMRWGRAQLPTGLGMRPSRIPTHLLFHGPGRILLQSSNPAVSVLQPRPLVEDDGRRQRPSESPGPQLTSASFSRRLLMAVVRPTRKLVLVVVGLLALLLSSQLLLNALDVGFSAAIAEAPMQAATLLRTLGRTAMDGSSAAAVFLTSAVEYSSEKASAASRERSSRFGESWS